MNQKIVSRFDGRTLYECEADSLLEFLRQAVASGANLCGADLRGANLCGADLRGADLYGADLRGADLYGADLRGADLYGANLCDANLRGANLRGADLYGANLRGANLRGANLRGADLYGANLRGANLNWQSHDVVAEILRRAARDDIQKRMVAGLILVSRDWCWEQFLAIEHEQREWALATLREFVRDGDNAPKILRQYDQTTATATTE